MKHKRIIAALLAAGVLSMSGAVFADEATPAPDYDTNAELAELNENSGNIENTEAAEQTTAAPDTAEPTEASPSATAVPYEDNAVSQPIDVSAPTISSYDVYFDCVLDGWPRKDYAVFNLYSEDGTMLDSHTEYISEPSGFEAHFSVPESPVGTVFYLDVSGINSIDYYSDSYALPLETKLPLYTYLSDPDENGERTPVSSAYMTAHMRTQCPINIFVYGTQVSLSSPAIFESSSIIAPLSEIAEAIGITDCTYFPKYNSVRVETGDHIMYVNVGATYYSMYDNTMFFNVPVSNINSLTYVELRPFVEAFGSTLEFNDYGSYCDINLTKSPKALESIAQLEARVNESGIGSKTDYMIWVNKEKFRLSVFEGAKGNWKWVKDFTVGTGASGSETITGVFEYSDYTNMWPYTSYYVGPVLVFYGNYAIHSTFLNYDGTPYDNTVGAKVSHGCVRCQAKYINWLAYYMPKGTRVYITEN